MERCLETTPNKLPAAELIEKEKVEDFVNDASCTTCQLRLALAGLDAEERLVASGQTTDCVSPLKYMTIIYFNIFYSSITIYIPHIKIKNI
jgi:hypothetical protein